MAVLIKNEQQVKACEEINAMLEEVAMINDLLNGRYGDSYSIFATKKVQLPVDKTFSEKLEYVLKLQRAKRIKDINIKANKFHVALDEKDEALISEDAIMRLRKTTQKPVRETDLSEKTDNY